MTLQIFRGLRSHYEILRCIPNRVLSTQLYSTEAFNSNQQHQAQQHSHPSDFTTGDNTSTDKEVQHHARFASTWWDANGSMRALHALNEIRVPFIRDGIVARGNVDPTLINTPKVLSKQSILEIGCGGGILTEQLARLNAKVTAIDIGEDVIKAAQDHLKNYSPELAEYITYKIESVEVHVENYTDYYDAVIVSEVLEHIENKPAFLSSCIQTLKPGGSIFITTLNKTLSMWVGGILIGEYVLGLAPKGSHHWNKLISPLDVQRILDTMNCQTVLVNGSTYDFWRNTWRWTKSTSLCYALQAVKSESS